MSGVYTKKHVEDVFDTSKGALPYKLQRIAEEELGETPARRQDALAKLAALLSADGDLNARKDAEFLLRFLRVRKYDVEAALRTIRNYYGIRNTSGPVFQDFSPRKVTSATRKLMMVMPDTDVHGRPIFLYKPAEPDLNANKDTEFLLRFLRVRKYNVESALQTIRTYYRNRASSESLYHDFLPAKVPSAARKIILILPERDVHGRPVLLVKPGSWMPDEVSYLDLHRAGLFCLEHLAQDPVTQVLGMVLLVDYGGFTVDKLLFLNITLLRRGLEYLQV